LICFWGEEGNSEGLLRIFVVGIVFHFCGCVDGEVEVF